MNSGDNVLDGIPVGPDEARLVGQYLATHDLASNSRKVITQDVRKFARWFVSASGVGMSFRAAIALRVPPLAVPRKRCAESNSLKLS